VILLGQATGASEVETLTLSNPWNSALTYNSTVVTDNGTAWLTQSPASGSIPVGATSNITLQANTKGLASGLQHGVLRVAFIDGTVHTVDVYLIVPAVSALSSNSILSTETSRLETLAPASIAESCPGNTGFAVVLRSPEPGFQVNAQVPVPLQLTARDCATGKVIRQASGAAAQVLVDGAPPISLVDDGAGNWSGTWTPSAAASQINLIGRVDQYVGSQAAVVSGQDTLTGTVNPAPAGAAGVIVQVVNGGSPQLQGSVTPGSWVSLFGIAMGDSNASASQTPFPSLLGGTQVLLQGQPLPLYRVNSTEVDALIPTGINANERQQLVIQRGTTQSPSVDVRVTTSSSHPGQP
jgi:hypothetical protein